MNKLLTVPYVAERLGMPQRTVRWWITAGKLPAQKLGHDWIMEDDDVTMVERTRMLYAANCARIADEKQLKH